uniref:Beta-1,3-glucan phosphorylase n=1 Tax=Euglena gracilis TaxID=3039 RepID=A0A8D5B407_EUGGR|nr:beta-1,3-glucan phosphorylase [Euglena gracilis]
MSVDLEYLAHHGIPDLLDQLVLGLLARKPPDPAAFMWSEVSKLATRVTSGPLQLSQTTVQKPCPFVDGQYVTRDGESWFKIANFDKMQPFFMSIVSASNFWLFASSRGSLTCGRVSAEYSLFPYYTVDKIHDGHTTTGPRTAMHVTKGGRTYLWEPFVLEPAVFKTRRNLYKNKLGNLLVYEEHNDDLDLTFSYTWATSDTYGIVRKCSLVNTSRDRVKVRLLDGLQNILPANTNGWLQDCMSTLLEAYKWNELLRQQVGLFCLYATPSDRSDPAESLKATTVWHEGLPAPDVLLSSAQLGAFLRGEDVHAEDLVRGQRGAFFVHSYLDLAGHAEAKWMLVAEVDQTHLTISALQRTLAANRPALPGRIDADIAAGSAELRRIMGAADAFQCLEDEATSTHHYANVMFNTMRGGIYDNGYDIDRGDLIAFVTKRNTAVAQKHTGWLHGLPNPLNYLDLLAQAQRRGDASLARLCFEYIPVTFSRRHGDPSRPWNKFAIQLKDEDGRRILNYQGNWRDIFQNWEALTISFPSYFGSIIAKFVNASTMDGYNPYVVNKTDGIHWECPGPGSKFHPGSLEANCDKDYFSYANVPYEIRPYEKIVEDAKDTIVFNWDKHNAIEKLQKTMGADAKLVLCKDGSVVHVNLAEKLLVPLLAKASNFVVEGGIWLNTQRPEWNDANNAIVGFGLSMVTVYYMRRYVTFLRGLFNTLGTKSLPISEEVAVWLAGVAQVFSTNLALLRKGRLTSRERRRVLDALGDVASTYRARVYRSGLSGGRTAVAATAVLTFLDALQPFIDHSIHVNRKDNGLYHAYNLLALGPNTADISYLYDMLEGQVSALSSGLITANAAEEMFCSLFASDMYRPDQNTFMLYPDRQLKGFMDRNLIPAHRRSSAAVQYCLRRGVKGVLYEDARGGLRWAAGLCNAKDLKATVEASPDPGLKQHAAELLALYEEVFVHRAFTGRSGTMFGFEGLGCIYWHMVSKVLLAAQELTLDALDRRDGSMAALRAAYYELRGGIGFNKAPQEYGAFPSDPYSHTPKHAGAQQPGMTGQVKEEILTRFGELGIRIVHGTIRVEPRLLRPSEFLTAAKDFEYVALGGAPQRVPLQPGQLGFTYCQCPFVYARGKVLRMVVTCRAKKVYINGHDLRRDLATHIFKRSGEVLRVDVEIPDKELFYV